MSFTDDGLGGFLDLPDITSDLERLETPTNEPTPSPTPLPAEAAPEPTPRPTPLPSFVETPSPSVDVVSYPAVDEALDYNKTLAPTSYEPLFSTPHPTDSSTPSPSNANEITEVEPQEVAQQKSYFSCPAPAPKMILSEDENGVPINVMIEPPLASCEVSYDFELMLDEPSNTAETLASGSMETESQELAYIQTLLPGIGDRLGESVANYLSLHTEYGPNETQCEGFLVDEWRRRIQHRLRSESNDELTRIISLEGEEYAIDAVNVCNPPTRGCYVVNGRMSAAYVGYDEPGVKSTVSRLVKDEMSSITPKSGNDRDKVSYSLKYLGPSGDVLAQAPATPSAFISMEDIAQYVPTEFKPTPIGIGIIAALSAAFVMMLYSACSRNDELKEEVIDDVQEIKGKMKKGKSKKRKKNVPLVDDEPSESDSGYDLESVAIDVNRDGENDSQEAVEIMETVSFGHDTAVQHMTREEKKSKYSLAAAVNTIPRVEPIRLSRDIRKKNSPRRVAASRSAKLAAEISADIRMISGCADAQTSADANITAFQLPNPAGKSGGACTAALLEALYKGNKKSSRQSWVDLLQRMRTNLTNKGYDQKPQLTSSSVIDVNEPMEIVPNTTGVKRAVLIGINYKGQDGELSGCHNDVKHIAQYLQKVHGFKKENMTVLLDNGKCEEPTYAKIMMTLERIARESQPGDFVWLHYSGHGGRLPDESGDEEDGMDETIIPIDFKRRGQIRDDDLLKYFVKPMKRGVTVTCIMDCCHSGTVLDLPYQFIADGEHSAMESNKIFFKDLLNKTDLFNASGTAGAGSRSILEDLEASESSSPPARNSPRRSDSYNIQTLPSVPETDLPPPTHDTPSHRSKWSRLISPTAVNEFDHDAAIIRMENSQGEEQWEV